MISLRKSRNTITLDVRTPADSMADFVNAWNEGKPQKSALISFATPELLWRVLNPKRWEILKAFVEQAQYQSAKLQGVLGVMLKPSTPM